MNQASRVILTYQHTEQWGNVNSNPPGFSFCTFFLYFVPTPQNSSVQTLQVLTPQSAMLPWKLQLPHKYISSSPFHSKQTKKLPLTFSQTPLTNKSPLLWQLPVTTLCFILLDNNYVFNEHTQKAKRISQRNIF